jgi:hypothetical protein
MPLRLLGSDILFACSSTGYSNDKLNLTGLQSHQLKATYRMLIFDEDQSSFAECALINPRILESLSVKSLRKSLL